MKIERLAPTLDHIRKEYVLVQAWKKTASYMRAHNWFSDTLDLDIAAINLPSFIAETIERLESPADWQGAPLRIVPAPKSQRWRVSDDDRWEPAESGVTAARLRPLAHVGLRDQVVATAIMLCLADRVETRQGDPRRSIWDPLSRRRVLSYGNRLFCDADGDKLIHRWGSAKLYRGYYQDYRAFVSRPEIVGQSVSPANAGRLFVIHADLRQFYDRVRPSMLWSTLRSIQQPDDDSAFYELATRVFNWSWDPRDIREVAIYAAQAKLQDFDRIALPQGLVAAGFFANATLLTFDESLREAIGSEIGSGVSLLDTCRYVDDFRVVVAAANDDPDLVRDTVVTWLEDALSLSAPGLSLAEGDKTKIAAIDGTGRPLVRHSARMNRIQSAVSGGFDAVAGEEILDAIQGLLRSQAAINTSKPESGWKLSPLPDVRDDTVARFTAGRFRKTFRSIRPLLDAGPADDVQQSFAMATFARNRPSSVGNQRDLDEQGRAFALGLIEQWVQDPSNVRLLRIGLDIWPDPGILLPVLKLLRPFTEKGGRRKAPRRVAWYCLAELFRAGATETGIVGDEESLPSGVDLDRYRAVLRSEAGRLASLPAATIPWYLRQQALLFLAAFDPTGAPVIRTGTSPETSRYRNMIRFLRGDSARLPSRDFATFAVLARRSFATPARATELAQIDLTAARKREIAERDPSFAVEIIRSLNNPPLLRTFRRVRVTTLGLAWRHRTALRA